MAKQVSSKRPALRGGRIALAFSLAAALAAPVNVASASGEAFLSARMAVKAPAGARALCSTYDWACARSASSAALSDRQIQLAAEVTRRVNREVREVTDLDQYGRLEVWALPTRTGGDCEDFALQKKRELIRLGLPPERLLLASALDRARNPHAVLILRTDRGDYVLDNLTDRVLHWRQTGYTFLRMQDPARPTAWVAVLAGGIISDRG